jgi:hypothetical protein
VNSSGTYFFLSLSDRNGKSYIYVGPYFFSVSSK